MTDTNLSIPASKLHLSEENVRKDTANLAIPELAANIAAVGLINGLTVVSRSKPRGHFDVVAGGRRYRAIMHNIEAGIFAKDYEVPCTLREKTDNLTEVSFSENFERQAMTAADEIVTFGKLHDDGMTPDDIATRFGITRRNVDRRLKLTCLIPEIIDMLRDGTMTLDRAAAFAQAPSQDAQREMLPRMRNWSADQIHRSIVSEALSSSNPVAQFVGADAYTAAGGTISLDMLNPDADIWNDSDIANSLAAEKINSAAERIASEQGYAWVKPVLGTYVPYDETQSLRQIHIPYKPHTEEQEAQIDNLDEEYSKIENEIEESDEATDVSSLQDKLEEIWEAREKLARTEPVELTAEAKSKVGCFVHLSKEGELVIANTLYTEHRGRIDSDGQFVEPEQTSTTRTGETKATGETAAPALSARLADELRLQRRDVLAAHLASNPAIALDYMLFTAAEDRMSYYSSDSGTTLSISAPNDGTGPYPTGDANNHLAAVFEQLDKSWFESDRKSARFDAFAALDFNTKAEWAAYAMATSLVGLHGCGTSAVYTMHAHLARLMEVDFAAMWRPTAANYFDRVKKDLVLDAIEAVGGETLRARYASAKKRDLAATAEKIFSGEAIIEQDIKDSAAAWVPDELTFAGIDPDRNETNRRPRHTADIEPDVEETESEDEIDLADEDHIETDPDADLESADDSDLDEALTE